MCLLVQKIWQFICMALGVKYMIFQLYGTRCAVHDIPNYLTCFAYVATLNSINVATRQTV